MGRRNIYRILRDDDVLSGSTANWLDLGGLRRQHFPILEGDLGFFLETFTSLSDWSSKVSEWLPIAYDREWSDSGMTYYEVNCIADSGGDENFQLFSSRRVVR